MKHSLSNKENGFGLLVVLGMAVCLWGLLFQSVWAKSVVSFDGRFDLERNLLDIRFDFPALDALSPGLSLASSINAKVQKGHGHGYQVAFNLDHVQTPVCDLTSTIKGAMEIKNSREGTPIHVLGKIWSEFSLIDYKPVRELAGTFELRNEKLVVESLSFGNITCRGAVELQEPYVLDLSFSLNSVAMPDFLKFWIGSREAKFDSAGLVSGEIKVSGTWNRPVLRGKLESVNGFVDQLVYDSIVLNAEGVYPDLLISDSVIAQKNGLSFTFHGPISLKNLGDFKKQVGALTLSPLVSDSGSQREWTIKRLKSEEESGVTELKYLLRKNGTPGSGTQDGADMFGIERKIEF